MISCPRSYPFSRSGQTSGKSTQHCACGNAPPKSQESLHFAPASAPQLSPRLRRNCAALSGQDNRLANRRKSNPLFPNNPQPLHNFVYFSSTGRTASISPLSCAWRGKAGKLDAQGGAGALRRPLPVSGSLPGGASRLTWSDGFEGDGLLAVVEDPQHVVAGQAGHPDPLHLQK